MGLFFDEPKPDNEKISTPGNHHGFFAAAGLMLLGFLLSVLTYICKPALTWMFTFEGRTKEQIKTQVVVILVVITTFGFLFYKHIPYVRDVMSLSKTHTLNISDGKARILFPDRSYFVVESNSRPLRFRGHEHITYITYSGYNENVASRMESSDCPMVPRGEKIVLSSTSPPLQAEGFEDKVIYITSKSLDRLSGIDLFLAYIVFPKIMIFGTKEERSNQEWISKQKTSWKEFISNWGDIKHITNSLSRGFEIKALSDEHALVCF